MKGSREMAIWKSHRHDLYTYYISRRVEQRRKAEARAVDERDSPPSDPKTMALNSEAYLLKGFTVSRGQAIPRRLRNSHVVEESPYRPPWEKEDRLFTCRHLRRSFMVARGSYVAYPYFSRAKTPETPRYVNQANPQKQSGLQLRLLHECLLRHEGDRDDVALLLPRDGLAADWTRAFALISPLANQK